MCGRWPSGWPCGWSDGRAGEPADRERSSVLAAERMLRGRAVSFLRSFWLESGVLDEEMEAFVGEQSNEEGVGNAGAVDACGVSARRPTDSRGRSFRSAAVVKATWVRSRAAVAKASSEPGLSDLVAAGTETEATDGLVEW